MLTGLALIHYGIADRDAHQFASLAPQIIAAGAGIILLVGRRSGRAPLAGGAWSKPGNARPGRMVRRRPAIWQETD